MKKLLALCVCRALGVAGAAAGPALRRLRQRVDRQAGEVETDLHGPAVAGAGPRVAPLPHRRAAPGRVRAQPRARAVRRRGVEEAGSRGRRRSTATTSSTPRRARCRSRWWRRCATSRASARTAVRRRPRHEEPARRARLPRRSRPRATSTAPVVYAHSGNPEDYDVLRRSTASTCAARSSSSATRTRTATAASRRSPPSGAGAAAILIYSDPAEDGFKQGAGLPRRAVGAREPHPARRDHLRLHRARRPAHARLGVRPGARRRITPAEARSVPKIMAACRCRGRTRSRSSRSMDGPEAPKDWQGGLPIEYRLGRRARAGPPEGRHGQPRQARTTSSRRASAAPSCRTSGSSSATTATPGCSAASIRRAAPPR